MMESRSSRRCRCAAEITGIEPTTKELYYPLRLRVAGPDNQWWCRRAIRPCPNRYEEQAGLELAAAQDDKGRVFRAGAKRCRLVLANEEHHVWQPRAPGLVAKVAALRQHVRQRAGFGMLEAMAREGRSRPLDHGLLVRPREDPL